jgi:hypothetical protein
MCGRESPANEKEKFCFMDSIFNILGDDEFSEWWNWGACNVTCGEGTRQRSRYCKVVPTYPPAEDPYCTRPTEQYIPCYDEPCAGKKIHHVIVDVGQSQYSLLCRPTLAGLGPPRTVCLLWLAIRLPIVFH